MKITVHGLGRVGSTLAYTVLLKGLCDELALVTRDADKARGDGLDLRHASAFTSRPVRVTFGDLDVTSGSDILALCASTPTPADMKDRRELARPNAELFDTIVPPLLERSPHAVIVILSNPVDALTHRVLEKTGLPANRVVGAGTLVDSMRFRELLAEQVGIHPDDLRAYILGEHGEAQFPAWAAAEAGGEPIEHRPERDKLFEQSRQSGFDIFHAKGYTNYAIASAGAFILEAIAFDTRRVIPVSLRVDGFHGIDDVCLSLPAVVGRKGVHRVLHPELDEEEVQRLYAAADAVRETLALMDGSG